jgi:2-aminoadipate transaminase
LKIVARESGRPVVLPMDDEGLDPDAIEGEAAFLYTIPTFQNPSGRTLSLERRRRLAELARDGRLLVVEDDPYRYVRFEGDDLPSIWELAEGEGVVYSFSFSKIVAPGLRVGYLLAAKELIARLEALAVQTYLTPALLPEATVLEFIERGLLEPSMQRVRTLIGQRRDAMLEGLVAELPEGCSWSRPDGGYFLWLQFPEGSDTRELLRRGEQAGVTFIAGADFFPGGDQGVNGARLAYSFVSLPEVREGVERLASLLRAPAASAVTV